MRSKIPTMNLCWRFAMDYRSSRIGYCAHCESCCIYIKLMNRYFGSNTHAILFVRFVVILRSFNGNIESSGPHYGPL